MDGKTTYFTKSTISTCLNLYELIKFAIKDGDYILVNFLINKRLNYISMIIDHNTKNHGFIIKELETTNIIFYGQALTDQQYTNKLIYYTKRVGCNIEDLIEEVCNHKDWVMLQYIYTNEKQKIIDYTRQEDEAYEESLKLKNRKFFILQF